MTKICEDFELRAVQRCGNLVDFEKRCKMRPWTQKSALIQLRTSLLKFDDLAENFERSSVSNFSTKAGAAAFGSGELLLAAALLAAGLGSSAAAGSGARTAVLMRAGLLAVLAALTVWASDVSNSESDRIFV